MLKMANTNPVDDPADFLNSRWSAIESSGFYICDSQPEELLILWLL